MADLKPQNYDEQYDDDEFEECEVDVLTKVEERYSVEEDVDDSDTDTSLSPGTQLKKFKPVYNAPLVKSNTIYNSHYDSSSEDEEVIVGQTIAEINTIAMDLSSASEVREKSFHKFATETKNIYEGDQTVDDEPRSKPKSATRSITDFIRERKRLLREEQQLQQFDNDETESEHEHDDEDEENIDIDDQAISEYEDRSLIRTDEEVDSSRNVSYIKLHYSHKETLEVETAAQNIKLNSEEENVKRNDTEDSETEEESYDEDGEADQNQASLTISHQDSATNDYEGEDRYEDDFEDYDSDDQSDERNSVDFNQCETQNHEEEYKDETECDEMDVDNNAEANELSSHISQLQLHEKQSEESLTDTTDHTKITTIRSANDQNENGSSSGIEGLEGMIKALNLFKQTLSAVEASNEATSRHSAHTIASSTSDIAAELAAVNQNDHNQFKSRPLKAFASHSKIPRIISSLKKSCTSLRQSQSDPIQYKSSMKGDAVDLCKKENTQDAASDYDSCSTTSSKSKHHMEAQHSPSSISQKSGRSKGPQQKLHTKMGAISDYDSCSTSSSKLNCRIQSRTPTSFNSDQHVMHMNIIKSRSKCKIPMESKTPQRKNFSFSNERLREIERHNMILLKKIESQKPSYGPPKKEKCKPSPAAAARISSAAVNRKKQQRQIDIDNQVLKRKLEAISYRRTKQP